MHMCTWKSTFLLIFSRKIYFRKKERGATGHAAVVRGPAPPRIFFAPEPSSQETESLLHPGPPAVDVGDSVY